MFLSRKKIRFYTRSSWRHRDGRASTPSYAHRSPPSSLSRSLLVLNRAKASRRLAISLETLDFHPFQSTDTMTISKPEAACVYAALVLIDDDIDVTVNISAVLFARAATSIPKSACRRSCIFQYRAYTIEFYRFLVFACHYNLVDDFPLSAVTRVQTHSIWFRTEL